MKNTAKIKISCQECDTSEVYIDPDDYSLHRNLGDLAFVLYDCPSCRELYSEDSHLVIKQLGENQTNILKGTQGAIIKELPSELLDPVRQSKADAISTHDIYDARLVINLRRLLIEELNVYN